MVAAITTIAVSMICIGIGVRVGWVLSARSYGGWLVRPHTPATLGRMPEPEATTQPENSGIYVAEGRFVNQGFPGGGSRMD